MGVAYLDSYQPITEVRLPLAVSNGAKIKYAYRDDVDGRVLFRALVARWILPPRRIITMSVTFLSPLLAETLYLSGKPLIRCLSRIASYIIARLWEGIAPLCSSRGGYYSYQILGRSRG